MGVREDDSQFAQPSEVSDVRERRIALQGSREPGVGRPERRRTGGAPKALCIHGKGQLALNQLVQSTGRED